MSKEQPKETNILDILLVLAKYKMFIITFVFVITLISLIISLVWPHTYKSSGTIIPVSQQTSLPGGISGLLSGTVQAQMDFPQLNSEVLLNILNGRELRENVIHEFNFEEIYNSDIMEELLLKLDEDIEITENREGGFGFNPIYSISVSFYSEEPERSHNVTRYILEQLDRKVREINRENSREYFKILENRYQKNLEDLRSAEDTLLAFQEQYGILEVDEQAQQVIEQLGELKAGSIETEMRISVLRQTVREDNPELRNLNRTKNEYDRQFDDLMEKSDKLNTRADGFYSLLDLPELGITYLRLYREVEIQSSVLEAIYPQYESQKMVVEADRRGVQIIDPPRIPTYKDSPKRAYIVLGGMFFSIFLALTIVFSRNMVEQGRQKNTENYRKLRELGEQFRIRKKKNTGPDSES